MSQAPDDGTGSSVLINFLSDPATLVGLGVVAAGAAYYLSSRTTPLSLPISLANQLSEASGEEGAHRSPFLKSEELTACLFEDARTTYQCFQRGKRESNNGPCLGWRPGPKQPYQWLTYQQIEDAATVFGAGLVQLGIETGQKSFVGVFSQNCVEWVVTEQSCNCYSRILVPLYDTLGPEAITYIMNQTCMTVVVCDPNKIEVLTQQCSKFPSLKTIVKMREDVTEQEKALGAENGLKIVSMEEVKEMGRANPVDIMPPQLESLATICYTSGTTGNPKGVMLSNANMVANVSGIYQHLSSAMTVHTDDVHISYLPLAHMMERIVQLLVYTLGARVGFFRGDVKELVDDIQTLRPTVFISVPRLLNRIYDKVIAGVSTSPIKKWLFEKAMASKMSELRRGIIRRDSIWDWLIFSKIQKSLGGRVRFVVTGSAPISAKVLDFLRCSLGCVVCEGYGQTECSAAATATVPGDYMSGHVGVPLTCNLVKLVDVPDMNYFANKDQGEVCYKGPNVFQGYYKDEEKTREALDQDGWLHSGDIGQWLPNGTLKIIDRKKHIFKLAQGEYLAPEKIENIYIGSAYVAQVYLYGDSLKAACIAIVVPDEEVLMKWAKDNGIEGSFEDVCKTQEALKLIHADITRVGKESGLHSFEQAKAIHLEPVPFAVDNDCLTPTFKLRRPTLKSKYMEMFVSLYSQLPS